MTFFNIFYLTNHNSRLVPLGQIPSSVTDPNCIFGLKNPIGKWTSDPISLEKYVRKFYNNLFSANLIFHFKIPEKFMGLVNTSDKLTKNRLIYIPKTFEIKVVAFQFKPFKALGPIGYIQFSINKFGILLNQKSLNSFIIPSNFKIFQMVSITLYYASFLNVKILNA